MRLMITNMDGLHLVTRHVRSRRIRILFASARCRRQRDRRGQRVAAGAAATKSPACAVANANNATVGGKLFCAGVPGAATMLTG